MTNAITITTTTTLVNEAITVDNSLKLMALCSFSLAIGQADPRMTFYSALGML